MGFPGRTIDVPPPAPSPALAALVRATRHDPFGQREGLARALEGQAERVQGEPELGHLCATAWVLDEVAAHILLVHHRVLGWSTPGGHLELGEQPGVGAARELAEETGLDLVPLSDRPAVLHAATFPAGPSGPAHRHHNLGYRFTADPARALVAEQGADVAWFPVVQLPEPHVLDLEIVLALLRGEPAARPHG